MRWYWRNRWALILALAFTAVVLAACLFPDKKAARELRRFELTEKQSNGRPLTPAEQSELDGLRRP